MRKTTDRPIEIDQLAINWHLTQSCNYTCRYCYSTWDTGGVRREIFRDTAKSTSLLREIYRHFHPDNADNSLNDKLRWDSLRMSLAGGEPLLFPEETLRIANEANSIGFKVSLITNGRLLHQHKDSGLSKELSTLGISLDSANTETNIGIGRATSGQVLELDNLYETITLFRHQNPQIKIKVNTVVNELNWNEDMTSVIEAIRPDKWKVLKALPIITNDLSISNSKFNAYIARHQHFSRVISSEDNQEMTESYIMIDPQGRFFQNQTRPVSSASYLYSLPIIEVGAKQAFDEIHFSSDKFAHRYQEGVRGVDA